MSFKVDRFDNLTNKGSNKGYKGVDKLDTLTNSGSNNDPSVQPAAEVLHRERGKGDVPPSLQLYQVDGVHQRQIDLSTKNQGPARVGF